LWAASGITGIRISLSTPLRSWQRNGLRLGS
jgi:hypothetical protein